MLKIRNLDCSAFLISRGVDYNRFKKIGLNDCIWYFEDNRITKELLEKFLRGKVEVNITNFMYQRSVLKMYTKKESFVLKKTNNNTEIKAGENYYYVDGDNVIRHNVYAEKEPHISLIAKHKIFKDVEEAKSYKNNK